MEKPIGNKLHQKMQFIDMVGYNLRFHSCVLKAKEWRTSDFLGILSGPTLSALEFNDKPDYLRDGVILNWSHEIDLRFTRLARRQLEPAFPMRRNRWRTSPYPRQPLLFHHSLGLRNQA